MTRQRGLRAAGTRSLPWEDIEKCLNVVKEFRNGVLLEHFEAAYHKVNDRHLKYLQVCSNHVTFFWLTNIERTGWKIVVK